MPEMRICSEIWRVLAVVSLGIQGRFHELSEFDETKKSCRRRLAGHNERRRKSSYESYGEGSG
ncbi:hypothetical protein CsSME_00030459 [Camellia sinensis var. sinensis]